MWFCLPEFVCTCPGLSWVVLARSPQPAALVVVHLLVYSWCAWLPWPAFAVVAVMVPPGARSAFSPGLHWQRPGQLAVYMCRLQSAGCSWPRAGIVAAGRRCAQWPRFSAAIARRAGPEVRLWCRGVYWQPRPDTSRGLRD